MQYLSQELGALYLILTMPLLVKNPFPRIVNSVSLPMLQTTKLQREFWTKIWERKFLENAAHIPKKSPVPVFPLLGDNDSFDCPNFAEGLQYWLLNTSLRDSVGRFFDFWSYDTRWRHSWHYRQLLGRSIQLGNENNREPRSEKLRNEENRVGRVVIACHVKPGSASATFFDLLRLFIVNELGNGNGTPILLLHGHTHIWDYEPYLFILPSFLRINIAGETIEPPTFITINESG